MDDKAPTVTNSKPPVGEDYKQCTFVNEEPGWDMGAWIPNWATSWWPVRLVRDALNWVAEGFGAYAEDGAWVYMGYRMGRLESAISRRKEKERTGAWIYENDPNIINAMNEVATALANLGSHEVGHLFWLQHENDSGTIMDGGNTTDFCKDLNFSAASKKSLKEYFGNPSAIK